MDDPQPDATPRAPRDRWEVAEWLAFALAIGVLGLYVLPRRGGWEAQVVPTAVLALLPSLLVLRPWRHCPRWLMLLAAAPALGACVVAAVSPFGDGGPISLSRWGLFGAALLVSASFARTPERRSAVVVALVLLGLWQYAQAWLPWWGGGGTSTRSMVGTLYSANPFGGLMLLFALLAASTALLARGPVRRLGWVVAPLATCGVVFSAARAAILLLALGALVLLVLAVREGGLRGLLRWAVLVPVCVGVVVASSSSLFFDGSRGSGVGAKEASGQTLDSTTSVRIDYWKAAVGVFLDEPLVGGGSGSYLPASRPYMAPAAERSPFAHNEALGALAEGGLALGLPVLVLLGVALLSFGRVLVSAAARPARAEPERVALALAGGALVGHSMLDFALSFPVVLALLGVALGAVLSTPVRSGARSATVVAAATLAALVAAGGYLGLAHDDAGVGGRARLADTSVEAWPGVHDGRVQAAVARATSSEPAPDAESVDLALRGIADLLGLDASLASVRIDLLAATGRADLALVEARRLARDESTVTPLLVLPLVERLVASGLVVEAEAVATSGAALRAEESPQVRAALVEVLAAWPTRSRVSEPAWSCSVGALQSAGAAVERLVDRQALAVVDEGTCRRWLEQAAARAHAAMRGEA